MGCGGVAGEAAEEPQKRPDCPLVITVHAVGQHIAHRNTATWGDDREATALGQLRLEPVSFIPAKDGI